MALSLRSTIEQISDAEVCALRAAGGRVLSYHDVPPTASRAELWTGKKVEEYLLLLSRSRIEEDALWTLRGATTKKSERAREIVSKTNLPINAVLEFRRIYPTFWTAALSSDDNADVIQQLCVLARELDTLSDDPATDQRAT